MCLCCFFVIIFIKHNPNNPNNPSNQCIICNRYKGEMEWNQALQLHYTKDHILEYYEVPLERRIEEKFQDIPEDETPFLTDFYKYN